MLHIQVGVKVWVSRKIMRLIEQKVNLEAFEHDNICEPRFMFINRVVRVGVSSACVITPIPAFLLEPLNYTLGIGFRVVLAGDVEQRTDVL